MNGKLVAILLVVVAAGAGTLGVVFGPNLVPDKRIAGFEQAATTARRVAATEKDRADGLEKQLAAAAVLQHEAEKELDDAKHAQSQLADKAADAEKKATESEAAQTKLKAAIDKSSGSVSQEGDEIHLQLVDKVLFKIGDDQLTDHGKQVLDRVAVALKDLADKQIWVQGHTDDQPIVTPPPPTKKPPVKGAPPAPPVPPRFATNWELSAARALNVVHYLQDTAKIDPSRLAALAFGQYRPVSKTNKAANRRIEIVLYPKRVVAK